MVVPDNQKEIVEQVSKIEKEVDKLDKKSKEIFKNIEENLLNELGINLPSETNVSYFYEECNSDRLSFGDHHPNNKEFKNALKKSRFPIKTLGDLITLKEETIEPSKTEPNGIFVYAGLGNIESNTGNMMGIKKVIGRDIISKSKIIHKNQLIFSGLRPYLNKVFILEDYNQAIASAEFFVCEPKNVLLPFLKYYLLSEATLRQTKWILSGSNYPRLDEEDFLNLKVVIPEDIEEQKRILKLLNKEKEKFDRLRQKAEEKRKESKVTFEKLLMKELT